jgi:hypothetical protein
MPAVAACAAPAPAAPINRTLAAQMVPIQRRLEVKNGISEALSASRGMTL